MISSVLGLGTGDGEVIVAAEEAEGGGLLIIRVIAVASDRERCEKNSSVSESTDRVDSSSGRSKIEIKLTLIDTSNRYKLFERETHCKRHYFGRLLLQN